MPQSQTTGAPVAFSQRERKKRETSRRIVDEAMKLFMAGGYEGTTLDAITAAAGISRRTFFYYFRSKDDILLSLQRGDIQALCELVANAPPDQRPLEAVRDALLKLSAPYQTEEMVIIDRLMRSSETLLERKRSAYIEQEQELLDALRRRWPDPAQLGALRIVAMISVGATRLSIDAWREEGGKRPITAVIFETFVLLAKEIAKT